MIRQEEMPLDALRAGMRNLAVTFNIDGSGLFISRHVFREIEGVAHELVHSVVLFQRPTAYATIGKRIRSMTNKAADEHEAVVQRVEVEVLKAVGVSVSLRLLWQRGLWQERRPPWHRMVEPLSVEEVSFVNITLQWIWSTVL